MYDNAVTTGSITSSSAEKRRLAAESMAFNCKSPIFRKLFPEYVEKAAAQAQQPAAAPAAAAAGQGRAGATQTAQEQQAAGAAAGAQQQQGDGQAPAVVQTQAARGGGPTAGGAPGHMPKASSTGSTLMTVALVVVVLAVALAPLFKAQPVS